MEIIETRPKRWGNSLGITIPKEVVAREKITDKEKIRIIIIKENRTMEKSFGTLKGKIKRSTQEIKDELRKELYND